MIVKTHFLLLFLCCCSFSLFGIQFHGSLLRFDQENANFRAEEGNANISAQDIVRSSFNKTYALLQCPSNVHLRSCLNKTYHAHKSTSYPWWFRTLLRDSLDMRNGVFGPWHLLESTKNNTASVQMCTMGKVSSKQWRKVFCYLNAPANSKALCEDPKQRTVGISFNTSDASHQNKAARFVFLRDPLERFLSAFLDKCIGSNRLKERHCEPSIIFQNKHTATTHGLADNKKLLFEAYVDTMPLRWNMHFIPMGLFCDGLFRRLDEYDFVGYMGPDFYNNLFELGEAFDGILRSAVNNVFDVDQRRNEINVGVETSAATQVREYYTAATVRRALEYLSLDYVALKLPIPKWAEQMLQEEYS